MVHKNTKRWGVRMFVFNKEDSLIRNLELKANNGDYESAMKAALYYQYKG